jgi:hypothetical protein
MRAMIAPMTDRPQFRWGRAALHAGLALVLTIAVTGTLAAVFDVADPRRFGEGVGRFALFMVLGALGVSWLLQTGRRLAATIVGGLLLALLVGVVVLVATMAPSADARRHRFLAAGELVRDGAALRHTALRFSIPDPGPQLTERPELAAAQFPQAPDLRAWVYGDEASAAVVVVNLAAGQGTDARTFEAFFSGVLRGQTGVLEAEQKERWVKWDERRAHAYTVGATGHTRVDAYALPGGEALVLVSASPDAERFAELADGVKVEGR